MAFIFLPSLGTRKGCIVFQCPQLESTQSFLFLHNCKNFCSWHSNTTRQAYRRHPTGHALSSRFHSLVLCPSSHPEAEEAGLGASCQLSAGELQLAWPEPDREPRNQVPPAKQRLISAWLLCSELPGHSQWCWAGSGGFSP